MFNLAIDSKRVAVMSSPCGLRMSPEADIRRIAQRFGKKTERPTRFNLSKRSRRALDDYLKVSGKRNGELLFNGHRGPDRSEGLCCQSQTFWLRGADGGILRHESRAPPKFRPNKLWTRGRGAR